MDRQIYITPNLPPAPDNKIKKVLILIVIIVVVIALALLSFYLVKKIFTKRTATKQEQQKIEIKKAEVKQFYTNIEKTYKTDKDFDGISDEDEKKYKTSPTSSDTDNDGIQDLTEIKLYKTDPTKKDTDGDGYNDGYEVRRGFNPLGSGKLKN